MNNETNDLKEILKEWKMLFDFQKDVINHYRTLFLWSELQKGNPVHNWNHGKENIKTPEGQGEKDGTQ